MKYRAGPHPALSAEASLPTVADLRKQVADLWGGYQDARFGYVTIRSRSAARAHLAAQLLR